jgi:hypothetical protein
VTRGSLRWGIAAAALVLAGCGLSAFPATNRTTVQIVLRTSHVVAGRSIKGELVVYNPKAAINLTDRVGPPHCAPGFAVILMQGHFRNDVNFTLDCSTRPLVIAHGFTRFPIAVRTLYNSCVTLGGGPPSTNTPLCLSGDGIPRLPQGSYEAVIQWSTSVPLPRPAPVAVTLS